MKMFQTFVLIILAVVVLLSCSPNDSELPKPPPNIVWIVSEDNSKHYMRLFDENGIETPHIEQLAGRGIRFDRAFSNGAVCSVARSAIISGCYGPRTLTNYHRNIAPAAMPVSLQMFPAYLRKAGYYTVNNAKEDYNFIKGEDVWDESSPKASWKNRQNDQPFFYVHNIGTTHESSLHFSAKEMQAHKTQTNPTDYPVQPNHPNDSVFRYTNAYYRDKIQQMDQQVGAVIAELEKDSLLDHTIIFYYGDHGGVLPGSKGYVYETGLHVPMVAYVPPAYKHLSVWEAGDATEAFVSFVDLAPTVLRLAGLPVPSQMDGQAFMGKGLTKEVLEKRQTTFGYADRFDEKYDRVRSVRVGRYKYIRSYEPYNYDGLLNNYRYKQLAYQDWRSKYLEHELNETQKAFFQSRPAEMLFDVAADPYETHNLASDTSHAAILSQLRQKLNGWVTDMPDLSFYPEYYLLDQAIDNPVAFGQAHLSDIAHYAEIADLALVPVTEGKAQLIAALTSPDPWTRYTALMTCSSLGSEALPLQDYIIPIMSSDSLLINQVKAAEFLGLTQSADPADILVRCLYKSKNPTEALLILNSIALLASTSYHYHFDIKVDELHLDVRQDKMVKWRLTGLGLRI
ncbi:sulfatase-like hydrolase/transferase [Reichenbachiella agarivorans]|uniref:Sulfatase-like hydrolase/transferase n=1 Tax=Reichenbachiella agarivorans TaxID=2979464 RepID=A0ABY6CND2_9BACT|nr:sulfatase [Reichenbachiella agarivorans]UXP32036.1 sulfatase-like hydrolase/transferase [Reichenbachiella agarivorans]